MKTFENQEHGDECLQLTFYVRGGQKIYHLLIVHQFTQPAGCMYPFTHLPFNVSSFLHLPFLIPYLHSYPYSSHPATRPPHTYLGLTLLGHFWRLGYRPEQNSDAAHKPDFLRFLHISLLCSRSGKSIKRRQHRIR